MKCLSMWQPHASAVSVGSKRIETRHWETWYRGPLAIHAAKRRVLSELLDYHDDWVWIGALTALGWSSGNEVAADLALLPLGAVIATCNLVDCRPSESFTRDEIETPRYPDRPNPELYAWRESEMGNFGPRRFGWVLENIVRLPTPIPFIGHQTLFNVPDELIQASIEGRPLPLPPRPKKAALPKPAPPPAPPEPMQTTFAFER